MKVDRVSENKRLRDALEVVAKCLDGQPEYHEVGMGCGVEDHDINNRYEAAAFQMLIFDSEGAFLMTQDTEWKWWVGHDEEHYTTECDTRGEAIQVALEEYEGAWIVEAKKPPNLVLSDFIGVESLIESAEESAYEDYADPHGNPLFLVTPEQETELRSKVKAAVDMWQEDNKLIFSSYKFYDQRRCEYIQAPDTEVSET